MSLSAGSEVDAKQFMSEIFYGGKGKYIQDQNCSFSSHLSRCVRLISLIKFQCINLGDASSLVLFDTHEKQSQFSFSFLNLIFENIVG